MTRKKLRTMTLVGIIYFSVSGGPFGLEELISTSGAGIALLALVVVPIVFSVPTALMSAELGSAIPVEGGYYYWVKSALGPFAGFTVGIWQWLNAFLDTALYPVIAVDYLAQWFPALERGNGAILSLFDGRVSLDWHWLTAIAFMVPLAWLNIRGSRLVGDFSVLLMVLILLPFFVMTVLGLLRILGGSAALDAIPFTAPEQTPMAAFGAGLGIVIWNYIGWDQPSTVLGEVDRPGRTYLKALAISLPLIAIAYILPTIAALASGLHADDVTAWEDGDFAAAGGLLGGPWLMLAITVGALVSQIGLFSSLLMSGSRVPKVLAADGYLPQALARDGRYGTPTAAILVSCAIFAVFCALDFATLVNADIITNLAALMLEFAAFIVLRRRYPNLVRPFVVRGGWVAVGLVVALPAALTVYMVISTFHEEPGALWVGLGILAFGVLLYPVLTRFVKRGRPDAPVDIDLGAPARTATTAR
ncbi:MULTISPECIES: APC family permease [unclassified Microbacterium]|uniref:APC family permease n=1 Tax=unclassified Microbacterium TaxID=2609290 RepID=UPI00301780BE